MAEIELVIKIDEEQYKFIKQSMTIDKVKDYHALLYDICERIKDGTPLPENHGDLIDRNELTPDTEWSDYYDDFVSYSQGQINNAPTIIEADTESED